MREKVGPRPRVAGGRVPRSRTRAAPTTGARYPAGRQHRRGAAGIQRDGARPPARRGAPAAPRPVTSPNPRTSSITATRPSRAREPRHGDDPRGQAAVGPTPSRPDHPWRWRPAALWHNMPARRVGPVGSGRVWLSPVGVVRAGRGQQQQVVVDRGQHGGVGVALPVLLAARARRPGPGAELIAEHPQGGAGPGHDVGADRDDLAVGWGLVDGQAEPADRLGATGPGATSTSSNWPPWNTSTGSTIAGSTRPATTGHRPSTKPSTTISTTPRSPRPERNDPSLQDHRGGSDQAAGLIVRR
jgi:hypothetical protein